LSLWLIGATLPAAAETPKVSLAERVWEAVRALRPSRAADVPGRAQDFELFVLAEALDELGQRERADQYRAYLRAYFKQSPLVALLPAPQSEAPALDYFQPDPDLSRLLNTLYRGLAAASPALSTTELEDGVDLVLAAADAPYAPPAPEALQAFLRARPDSLWSGWAAYQLLWRNRLAHAGANESEAFSRFWLEHQGHPLGEEANEALDVRWVSPRKLALTSVLLPGLGEELMEPGLRENSGALYSEALYLVGAIAFAVAAQQSSRTANLTGAMIMFNLLMLNHSTSSERAFDAGLRLNRGGRRKFVVERQNRPITGPGCFDGEYYAPPAPESLAADLVLSVAYRSGGAGEAFRGQGWVRDEQLANLAFRAEYLGSVLDVARSQDFSLGLALAPYARIFTTHAEPIAGSPLADGVDALEAGAGAEVALLSRLDLGGSWGQIRVSLGPGYRQRRLDADGTYYTDAGLAATGTLALAMGGPGGSYWQFGFTLDDTFKPGAYQVETRTLDVPSRGWDIQSSLGVHF